MPPTDVQLVREVLARELQTINEYEQAATQATSDEVRTFLLHLAEEEKEHVAEAMQLIRRLDAGQEQRFSADTSAAHFAGQKPSAPAPGPAAAPAPMPRHEPMLSPARAMAQAELIHPAPPNGFTVGSLRKPPA